MGPCLTQVFAPHPVALPRDPQRAIAHLSLFGDGVDFQPPALQNIPVPVLEHYLSLGGGQPVRRAKGNPLGKQAELAPAQHHVPLGAHLAAALLRRKRIGLQLHCVVAGVAQQRPELLGSCRSRCTGEKKG